MNATDVLGYIAAKHTTISFFPQAWRTFKTKDVSGISLGMYTIFTIGIAAWLAYGIALTAWPVIVANAITLIMSLGIWWMRWQYGKNYQPE